MLKALAGFLVGGLLAIGFCWYVTDKAMEPSAPVVQSATFDTQEGCLYAMIEEASLGLNEATGQIAQCDELTDKQRLEVGRMLIAATTNLTQG